MAEFHNTATMKEKLEILRNDTAQHSTYFQQARDTQGQELGGRFAHLARGQQQVVGSAPTSQYPQQQGYWAHADSNVEMPLGVSVEDVPDMVSVDGLSREPSSTPIRAYPPNASERGFKRRV